MSYITRYVTCASVDIESIHLQGIVNVNKSLRVLHVDNETCFVHYNIPVTTQFLIRMMFQEVAKSMIVHRFERLKDLNKYSQLEKIILISYVR